MKRLAVIMPLVIFVLWGAAVPKLSGQSVAATIPVAADERSLICIFIRRAASCFWSTWATPGSSFTIPLRSPCYGRSLSSYLPLEPWSCEVHEGDGKLYVAMLDNNWSWYTDSIVLVLDAGTYAVDASIPVANSGLLKLDESHDRLYVYTVNALTAIDTASRTVLGSLDITALMDGGLVAGIRLNPVTGEWVFGNLHYDKFLIVNGPTLTPELISIPGSRGWTVGWNHLENKIYITTAAWSGYFIYDRDTGASQTTPCVNDGTSLFFNPETNRVYTSAEINEDTTVIEGATDACRNVGMPEGGLTYLNFVEGRHHAVFISETEGIVYFLDEDTFKIARTFPDCGPGYYRQDAVDQAHQRVFILYTDTTLHSSHIVVFDYHEPSLTLVSPDGGESWQAGSPHAITWKSTGTIANVKLEYSTNDGAAWTTIAASTPNDLNYAWTLPSVGALSCLVRVSDASNAAVNDTSDAPFSISLPLGPALDNTSLTWVTGGAASWLGQTAVAYYGGSAAQSGLIADQQSTYVQTVVTGPGDLSFYWKVSSDGFFDDYLTFTIDDAEQDKIKGEVAWQQKQYLVGPGSHTLKWTYSKGEFFSYGSDAAWLDKVVFTALAGESITVLSPNGGESWASGTPANISWSSVSVSGEVKIEFSSDGGSTWREVVPATANDGAYAWVVPASPSMSCLVRIGGVAGGPSDTSDATFTVTLGGPAAADELVADFGSLGLWARSAGAWLQLSGTNADGMIGVDVDGSADQEIAGDFGALGLWFWNNAAWSQLSGVNVESMASLNVDGSAAGGIAADFGAVGLWIWNAGAWTQASGVNADSLTPAGLDADAPQELAVDFGSIGLWLWDGGAWTQLSGVNAESLIAGNLSLDPGQEIVADFGYLGLWIWDSGAWAQISDKDAVAMTAADVDADGTEEVIAGFQGFGIWVWDSGAWSKISDQAPDQLLAVNIDGDAADEVAADLGVMGTWTWNGGTWTQISAGNPGSLICADLDGNWVEEIVADMGATGLWIFTAGGWSQLSLFDVDSMIAIVGDPNN